jgi:SAM-dependent methyltransferase
MSLAVVANRRFYDALWSASDVVTPQRFNTWPLLSALAATTPARLEVGPGLHPRLPIDGTHFVDVSQSALSRLEGHGGLTTLGEINALPFRDGTFDLVCAFDIVEHVEDDRQAFHELARVARNGATVIFSVPLHSTRWTSFDTLVVMFDATIPMISEPFWASTPSRSSRVQPSACNPEPAGSWTSPSGP